jgi:hypothetical protein
MFKKYSLSVFILLVSASVLAQADAHQILSPDGKIIVKIALNAEKGLTYQLSYLNQAVVLDSRFGIKVNGENNSWKEGAFIGFIDAYEHETFNHSKSERIIILMDVIRPEFIRKRAWITSVVMTSLFLQKRAVKWPFIYRAPQWIITLSAIILLPFAYLSVKFLNIIRYY